MHANEIRTEESLVRRLLVTQFPRWAGLAVVNVRSSGTDNAWYRLGDDVLVRLPRIHWAVDDVIKEQRWLSKLAPHLPVEVPTPLAIFGVSTRGPDRTCYPIEPGPGVVRRLRVPPP